MFEDATFHSSGILRNQTPKWMLVALGANLTALSALIVVPLLFPQGLPIGLLRQALYLPAPPPVARPIIHTVPAAATPMLSLRNPFAAPSVIPTHISVVPDNPPPSANLSLDNVAGSTPGGLASADSPFHTQPVQVVHPAQPTRANISGGVTEGLLLSRTTPVYPAIAIAAHISGTVVLAAIISKTGKIENLQVLSGHPMLRQSAIDAVQNWRYRPYLLNHQPVEVETTINVVFSMGNR